jgi:hypothetical protein
MTPGREVVGDATGETPMMYPRNSSLPDPCPGLAAGMPHKACRDGAQALRRHSSEPILGVHVSTSGAAPPTGSIKGPTRRRMDISRAHCRHSLCTCLTGAPPPKWACHVAEGESSSARRPDRLEAIRARFQRPVKSDRRRRLPEISAASRWLDCSPTCIRAKFSASGSMHSVQCSPLKQLLRIEIDLAVRSEVDARAR